MSGDNKKRMKTDQAVPTNIDEYIAGFPPNIQEILEKIRQTIKAARRKKS
jgi:Ni,Fe-hydrogenase III small subunit